MTALHWHEGQNVPGYLPMDDDAPYCFETFSDAARSMQDRLEREADFLCSSDYEETRALGDEYAAAQADLTYASGPDWLVYLPSSTSAHDLGLAFWITSCQEDDCTNEEDQ